MTTAVTIEVRHIDPKLIHPDPTNPRGKLREISAMAASIAEHGVLEAITVRPDPKKPGEWLIIRGHRRHAGALAAKAGSIPTKIEGDEGANDKSRAIQRMVENLQRDDLTVSEEIRGVQQILDLGATPEEVATGLSVPLENVNRAKTIAASKTATTVTEKYDLDMGQALDLAEFDGSPTVVKELTAVAKSRPGDWDHSVARFRRARDNATAVTAATQEITAKGYKVLKERPSYDDQKVVDIDYLAISATNKARLTHKAHANCPGRACLIGIDYNGKASIRDEYCVNPSANGHVNTRSSAGRSSTAASRSEKQIEADRLERRTHLACINAGRAAEGVRREFVRQLLKRKSAPTSVLPFVVAQVLSHRIDDQTATFCDLTGASLPATAYHGVYGPQKKFLGTLSVAQLPLGLFARVAADIEASWEPNTWNLKGRAETKTQRVAYLTLLIGAGYVPSTVEKVLLKEAQPAQVLAESEAIKAAAKGRISVREVTAGAPVKKAVKRQAARRRAPARRAAS